MSCIFSSVDKGERKKNPRELYISWIGLRINKNKRHFHSCKFRSFIKSNTSVFHLLISQTSSQRHGQPFLEACGTSKRESKHNLRCIDLVISNSLAEHEVSGCDAEMQSLFVFLSGSIQMSTDGRNMFCLVFLEHESFYCGALQRPVFFHNAVHLDLIRFRPHVGL